MSGEERKKEGKNGCFGRMHEGCASLLFVEKDNGKGREKGGVRNGRGRLGRA